MAGELQAAYSVSLPSGGLDGHMMLVLVIMVVTGALGGVANVFLAERQGPPTRHDWVKYPVFGIVAALTVPLFLNMIASTLLEGARTKPIDLFVFAGFCLLYVVASRRLFDNIAQHLLGQMEHVRRDVLHLKTAQAEHGAAIAALPTRAEAEVAAVPELPKAPEPDPREVLSYNDVEILRALQAERFVYGNLAALCERTGLPRDLVSQRLTVLKTLGVIETRINERNVLHWMVSARGKAVLDDILCSNEDKKTA